jgi:rod shape-determining protein MreC
MQIKRGDQVRLIRVWAVSVITPAQRAVSWSISKVQSGWRNYIGLRGSAQENASLREELNRLKLRNAELESRAAEADRLAALLGFRGSHPDVPMVVARVIGAAAAGASKTIYINRGEADGLRRNMGVITPEGVVGKVIDVYSDTAQVQLLTDKESGMGALLASSRTQSPVGGIGEPMLMMKYITNDEKVPIGERVMTSGLDRIFPKDLPVGTVASTKPGNPFQEIRIRPAARLDQLEEVIVLLSRQELEPQKPAGDAIPRSAAKPASAPR